MHISKEKCTLVVMSFTLKVVSFCLYALTCVNRNITMLHYLIMIFEKNYPDTLHIQEDLCSVPEAAKVK